MADQPIATNANLAWPWPVLSLRLTRLHARLAQGGKLARGGGESQVRRQRSAESCEETLSQHLPFSLLTTLISLPSFEPLRAQYAGLRLHSFVGQH